MIKTGLTYSFTSIGQEAKQEKAFTVNSNSKSLLFYCRGQQFAFTLTMLMLARGALEISSHCANWTVSALPLWKSSAER